MCPTASSRLAVLVRFLVIASLAALVCVSPALCQNAKLTVSVIDVGQGDSILVQFPSGQDMLVDAGDREHGRAVVDYLRSLKISCIDILVATHPHEDHIGGMADVLSAFKIGRVWDSGYNHGSKQQQQFLLTIKEKGIRFGTPRAGFSECVGNARIDVLAPSHLLSGTDSDANNNSLVLRVLYGKISLLLTGDMEGAERSTIPSFPRSTLLKVAHHGSGNGTDAAFLHAVSPEVAVISAAAQNRYGHPHPETLAALKSIGARTLTTATSGTVVITTDGGTITVNTTKSGPALIDASGNASAGHGQYIGNLRSHIFHCPSCSTLPAEKNRVYFDSRSRAVSAGYRPCRRCSP